MVGFNNRLDIVERELIKKVQRNYPKYLQRKTISNKVKKID